MNINKPIFLFAALLCASLNFSQCPSPGDIILYNQDDVIEFLAKYGSCEIIDGNLYIGSDVTDLSNLTAIRRVEGTLRLSYSDNPSVSNFSNLEYVGGNFVIDQCHNIEVIEGIDKLHTVNGDFIISQNYNNLKEINGFKSLQHVGGFFQIARNHVLTSLTEFESLLKVEGALAISDNRSLASLTGFNKLVKIGTTLDISSFAGNLDIEDNRLLEEINGFNSLVEIVRNLEIGRNYSLKRIAGFSNLAQVTSQISIGGSPQLSEIPSFYNLTTLGSGLEIGGTGLTSLDGFNNLHVIGDLDPSWGNLYLRDNRELEEINGFAKLRMLEGEVSIVNHPKLTEMDGFLGLTQVRGINIYGNEVLTNLDGLQNIRKVEIIGGRALGIAQNPALVDCSAICDLLTHGSVVGTVIIFGNPSKCSSENEIREECIPDFDNDAILDADDLDDDNDGILDVVEQNGIVNRDSDGDGFPDHMDLDSDGDQCFDVAEAGFTDADGNGTLGGFPDTVDANGLVNGETDGYTIPMDYDSNGTFDFQEPNQLSAGIDNNLNICISQSPVELFDVLGGNPDSGGVWSPELSSKYGIFNPAIDPGGLYTYTVNNGICGYSTATIEVTVDPLPNSGSNGSITLCASDSEVDLFLSLGGNPDSGGFWSPGLFSGSGIFDPAIDEAGSYVYTTSNGNCAEDYAEIEVIVNTAPNAGLDSEFNICITDSPINLYHQLNGNPDAGGFWSPALASGSSIFDPKIDSPGVYTYSVYNNACPESSATIGVTVFQEPEAGFNGELVVCVDEAPIDLFNGLGGTPDIGGSWSPELSSGTGIFNPLIDKPGVYTYIVNNGSCKESSAHVEVYVEPLPNAGEGSEISICVNNGLADLFELLGGDPQPGGTWVPDLKGGNGIFDPMLDEPGSYTYSVTTENCGSDFATLEISIIEVFPITDFNLEKSRWNGDNTVTLNIASNRIYEYSINGVEYQLSNVFRGIPGGHYTIYARELNGCGILAERFSIVDYPRFFTPNGDGVNDYWQLIGIGPEKYTIEIFDRYGKLVKQLQPSYPGWDGRYNGQLLPSSDYWFNVKFVNGDSQSGHFSLKR